MCQFSTPPFGIDELIKQTSVIDDDFLLFRKTMASYAGLVCIFHYYYKGFVLYRLVLFT